MDERQRDLLIQKMRGDVSNALGAVDALARLVREQGTAEDRAHLAMLSQALYQEMRTILHLELTREEDPTFRPWSADLGELCLRLSRQMDSLAAPLGLRFTFRVEPEHLTVLMDPELMELAILLLLSNAATAAGQGGQVSLQLQQRGRTAILTVTDDGPGLSSPSRQEVTAPLLTGGLGLGLQAARRVARLHGGALVLEDREDKGVRAALSIPVATGEDRVEAPRMGYRLTGGYSPALIELADLLPLESYVPDDLD